MSIDDQNRVIGQRPLRKILMGDDAPRYLHIAQNKLQNMYRSNTSTEIVQVTQVDNARITVGKHTSHDVIKIEVEGYTWVAVATVGDFFYGTSPGYTQFAKAPKQTGKWSEKVIDSLATNPPIDDLGYAMPNGYLPLSSPYLCPTGDQGGWAFADAVGPTFITADGRVNPSAFTQLRNNYDANGVLYILGLINNLPFHYKFIKGYDDEPAPGAVGLLTMADFKLLWGKSTLADANGEITLQIASMGQFPLNNGSVPVRFQRTDTKYGAAIPTGNSDAYFNFPIYKNMVDSILSCGVGMGTERGYVSWDMLAPETYIGDSFYDAPAGGVFSSIKYFGSSIDGGRNWTFVTKATINDTPYEFPNLGSLEHTFYAAVNAVSALRLGVELTSQMITNSDGSTSTIPIFNRVVDLVFLDGSSVRKFQLPPVAGGYTFWGDIYMDSAAHGKLYPASINCLGRNCYVVRSPYEYRVGGDIAKKQYRIITFRTYDGGNTWDAPATEPFDYAYKEAQTNGAWGLNGQYDSPRLYSQFGIYPRLPYNSPADPGAVYQIIAQRSNLVDTATPSVSGNNYLCIGSFLYKSVDQCKTWAQVAQISHSTFNGGNFGPDAAKQQYDYQAIIDRNAQIDPIQPWRVDARVTPPDYWSGD